MTKANFRLQPSKDQPTIVISGNTLPISLRRIANARHLTLRLSPDGGEVRVSMPKWGQVSDALSFVRDRSDWLARRLSEIPQASPVKAGHTIPYRGLPHAIDHSDKYPRTPVIYNQTIQLGGDTEAIATRLQRWLKQEAIQIFTDDLAHYCAGISRPTPDLRLSQAMRRWGSCNHTGTIRLNWRLIMAPDSVRRAVVAHEVAHLVHFDHSPQFHALCRQIYGDNLDQQNLWLKQNGRTLFVPFE